ncbi:HD-GYP domain-containing protein [Ammoniphilus sp. YIM 78166]|uniref:HD-GYP domain-containing protein n=1 Tax=Ammoniphilus sp. YIM 78166 TaxID=1644106 RepID=UPI00106F9246|nr:HD-GYP domain-containing protein [Ammoniphilus sp. YIM 78166]
MLEATTAKFDFVPEEGKEKSPFYILAGVLSLLLGLTLDLYVFPENMLTLAYIPCMIMTGLIFRHAITIFILSGAVIISLLVHSTTEVWTIELFLLRWFIYFFLAIVIRVLVVNFQKEREHIVNLTSTLAEALDARDKYTSFHSQNVATYSRKIAKEMGLSNKQCQHIYIGGLLHDIGKIGVPEQILNKPSRLTKEEFQVIKKHPEIGYKMLSYIPFFKNNSILDMVRYHHEHYDGKGYPLGLVGDEIPLVARIMALADAFDAMTSRRAYREDIDLEYAVAEIKRNKGSQFDPEVTDVFLELIKEGKIKIVGSKRD